MHQGDAGAGVPRQVWTVLISGSGFSWASLGMGGLRRFGTFSCFAVGQTTVPLLGHPIYPHFLKYSKYSALYVTFVFCRPKALYMLKKEEMKSTYKHTMTHLCSSHKKIQCSRLMRILEKVLKSLLNLQALPHQRTDSRNTPDQRNDEEETETYG